MTCGADWTGSVNGGGVMVWHAQLRFTDSNAVSLQCSFRAAGLQAGLAMDETATWSADSVTTLARHCTFQQVAPRLTLTQCGASHYCTGLQKTHSTWACLCYMQRLRESHEWTYQPVSIPPSLSRIGNAMRGVGICCALQAGCVGAVACLEMSSVHDMHAYMCTNGLQKQEVGNVTWDGCMHEMSRWSNVGQQVECAAYEPKSQGCCGLLCMHNSVYSQQCNMRQQLPQCNHVSMKLVTFLSSHIVFPPRMLQLPAHLPTAAVMAYHSRTNANMILEEPYVHSSM